jgi:tetratricopeptide (TPR) repeat protein
LDKLNYQAYENLAKLLIRSDNNEKDYHLAKTYFENLLKIDRSNSSLYFQLGCMLVSDDNPGQNLKVGFENFAQAINYDKKNSQMNLVCGLIAIIKSTQDETLLNIGMNWLAKANR